MTSNACARDPVGKIDGLGLACHVAGAAAKAGPVRSGQFGAPPSAIDNIMPKET